MRGKKNNVTLETNNYVKSAKKFCNGRAQNFFDLVERACTERKSNSLIVISFAA